LQAQSYGLIPSGEPLCFKCYRVEERAAKAAATADPLWAKQGNGWLLRDQKKAFTIITNILKAISDCPGIEQEDVKQIQNILRPYLDRLAECFAPKKSSDQLSRCRPTVNSEQKNPCSLAATKNPGSQMSPTVNPNTKD